MHQIFKVGNGIDCSSFLHLCKPPCSAANSLNQEEDQREADCKASLHILPSSFLSARDYRLHFHNSEKTLSPSVSLSIHPSTSSPAIKE